jgi:hypothetical protein
MPPPLENPPNLSNLCPLAVKVSHTSPDESSLSLECIQQTPSSQDWERLGIYAQWC